MSTINVEKQGNVITLSGDLTFDFNQMKRECAGRYESMLFGDAEGVITKLKARGSSAMTHEQIMKLHEHGKTAGY